MLSADFLNLGKDVEMVNTHADIFHLDIMDGVLVPNISYGFPVVEAIAKMARKPLDAHLMIVSPEKYVERFAAAGAGMISFHAESTDRPQAILKTIRNAGAMAGLAFNPDYPLEKVFRLLPDCDFVVLMSVFAGFGGQKFIPESLPRLAALKNEIVRQGLGCLVEVDGGINPDNAGELVSAGADILVAGSAVFRATDPADVISRIRDAHRQ